MSKVIEFPEVTYEALVLRTFRFYFNLMKDA